MNKAVYPGSFDPITEGHLDIIRRSSKVFDELIVLVLVNPEKKGLFNIDERKELIERVTSSFGNVKVEAFHGLLVNYMKERNLNIITKGLRAVTDFEYEFQMALMNRKLSPTIETVFMMTNAKYSYLSSSAVKQVAMFGGDLNDLVPTEIIDDVRNKILSK
ncbi:pantetheine-phosphate adenylyltransferase [Clostridium sediminicola]|uniref:pantetheine-phosphate adenylyltransferase n=1 Tax=Clostridium sediminicola TaxID=3114879 RepID=UPI0031F2725F